MTNDNKPSAAPELEVPQEFPRIVDCVSVRVDDLNFLRNMAHRARLDGVDKAQYNEVLDRVMTAQEKFFAAFDDGSPPASVDQGKGPLREAQSKAVMPLIGPLLDAWDGLANDMLALEELAPVAEVMAQIDSAMEAGQ